MMGLVEEADRFLNEKQEYLNQSNTNDFEIRNFNIESIKLQKKLKSKIVILRDLIFNKNKIEFIKSFDSSRLGYLDYDKCFTVYYNINF